MVGRERRPRTRDPQQSSASLQKPAPTSYDLPDSILDEITKLARIPSDKRKLLGIYLSRMIRAVWAPDTTTLALGDFVELRVVERTYAIPLLDRLGQNSLQLNEALQDCITYHDSSFVR
jgi:hypothetical protein